MRLNKVGFFRELNHGDRRPGDPSIHDRLPTHLLPDTPRIVAYLDAGSVYAVAAGPTIDIFKQPKRHIIGPLRLLTDGIWLWPSDLSYYVQHYQVTLPVAFIAHMKTQVWHPPQLDADQIQALQL